MSGHEDRLAGLVVLSAVLTGIPTVVVRGVPAPSLAGAVGRAVDLAEGAVPTGGAVVAAEDAAGVTVHLDSLGSAVPGRRPGLLWVLWDGHHRGAVHRAAAGLGLEPVASYRHVGSGASPTHLVREGPGHALRWFAASVRPRWGTRSRLARLGNHLPGVGHRFFDGTAVLFGTVRSDALRWPGADFVVPPDEQTTELVAELVDGTPSGAEGGTAVGAAGAPAVLHLGGGATAGRLVLTWADGSGAPTHHTKLAPAHLARDVVAEAKALSILGGISAVAGTVPTLLGLRQESTWAALTASHLPGRPPGATRPAPAAVRAIRRLAADPTEVDAVVTAWVAALSQASQGRPLPMTSAGASADRLNQAVASLDGALQSVVRRGLALGATAPGLLHGDLWPGNVHLVRASVGPTRIAVLDWESALVGHPLVDLLTWLVSSAGQGGQVRRGAVDALGGGPPHRQGSTAGQHVSTLLAAIGQHLEPSGIEALVLAQMVVIAVEGGPAGGHRVHERAWLDAVRDVWAAWQGTGRSPWSPRRGVLR